MIRRWHYRNINRPMSLDVPVDQINEFTVGGDSGKALSLVELPNLFFVAADAGSDGFAITEWRPGRWRAFLRIARKRVRPAKSGGCHVCETASEFTSS